MIKTKMTIPVRVMGVIGVIVLFASLYLPWATIEGKELLDATGTFSAMDLVQNTGSQILSYFFMGVYIIMILGLLALIYSIFGKPTTGLGVTMFITAGTYLALIIIMSSFFQSMIPGNVQLPGISGFEMKDTDEDRLLDQFEEMFGTDINNPDTDGDGLLDGDEVLDKPFSDPTLKDSDLDGIPDNEDRTPLGGMNEEMEGEEGNGSVDEDQQNIEDMLDTVNEFNDKMKMLTNTTVKAETGVYVTTGICVYIVIIGIILTIDRKKRKNLAIELKYHKKDLSAYKMAIEQALLDGYISDDELGMLDVQRKSMGITPEEHYTIVTTMAEERKANEEAIDMLLTILDDNFRYKTGGIFGGRKRPGPGGKRGPPRKGPRGESGGRSGGRPGRRRGPPRRRPRDDGYDDYDDHPDVPEAPSGSDDIASGKGKNEWDF